MLIPGVYKHIWKQAAKWKDGRSIMFTFWGMVEELKRLCCLGLVILSIS
jgi:hypothetical protein